MYTLKIVTAEGHESLREVKDPSWRQAENTITFINENGKSDQLTLLAGQTSAGGDIAYVMNSSGCTVSTWKHRHYATDASGCIQSLN